MLTVCVALCNMYILNLLQNMHGWIFSVFDVLLDDMSAWLRGHCYRLRQVYYRLSYLLKYNDAVH
jgi:hypothetical protein